MLKILLQSIYVFIYLNYKRTEPSMTNLVNKICPNPNSEEII